MQYLDFCDSNPFYVAFVDKKKKRNPIFFIIDLFDLEVTYSTCFL